MKTEKTEKDIWTHSTFYYENSYASQQVNAYTQEIKQYRDSVVLEQRGVDNGIHVDFYLRGTRESGFCLQGEITPTDATTGNK